MASNNEHRGFLADHWSRRIFSRIRSIRDRLLGSAIATAINESHENTLPRRELVESCGVFGVYGDDNAAQLTLSGLSDLQHRGQDSSGIAASDGKEIRYHKKEGLVAQVFKNGVIKKLPGHIAIGHDRYATSKGPDAKHAQPTYIADVDIALSHNGNISSTEPLEAFLTLKGINHGKLSDSEMIAEAVAVHIREGLTLEEAIKKVYPIIIGAFSMMIMDKTNLIAIRDKCGIRPLSIGTVEKNGATVFSSETCAFNPIGAKHLRDVNPGEMVVVNKEGIRSEQLAEGTQKLDIFEFVYFARPDSMLLGKSVHEVRENFGKELAKESRLDVDIVISVPNTGIPAATGYAEATGIPYKQGLFKARDRRNFIDPENETKLIAIPSVVRGKKVAVIDDSIVRGTTSKKIVQMLKDAGATEVHFLVTSPPVKYPDFYGIDTPNQEELIGAQKTPEEICEFLGATSLHYLSYDGMIRATELPEEIFNTSCFTGKYPIDIGEHAKGIKELLKNN